MERRQHVVATQANATGVSVCVVVKVAHMRPGWVRPGGAKTGAMCGLNKPVDHNTYIQAALVHSDG